MPKPHGDKFHPSSVDEAHTVLAPQAASMRAGVEKLPLGLRGRHVLFEATLHPNYLGSSYYPADVIEGMDLYVVGTRSDRAPLKTAKREKPDEPTKTLIIAGEPQKVLEFSKLAEAAPSSAPKKWEHLREFLHVGLPRPEAIILRRPQLGAGEVITWESVLSDIGRTDAEQDEWSVEGFAKWKAWIEKLGGEVSTAFSRRVGGLTFVPVALHGEVLNEAAKFNLLRAIRPMPQVRPVPESILRMVGKPPMAPAGGPRRADVTIAAFDGGVDAKSPYFAPFVTAQDLTPEAPNPLMMQHGTLVTSALLYGHIPPGTTLSQPMATVSHYRVLPAPPAVGNVDTQLYWVLDQIVATVRKDKLKLVNLSLGPDECVEDGREPTRWTVELDRLAHDERVMFVTASGNNGNEDAQLGYNRVQSPSDMVNGMGVGACASSDRSAKLVRAPYSAVGPGREGQRVQPTVVAFGGDGNTDQFIGIDAAGRLRQTAGTSFAAPIVTRAVADLLGSLGQDRRRPEVARAFCAHFAERKSRGHKATELGHGRCLSIFDAVWDCAPNTCTVVYDQTLARGQAVALRLPLPAGLDPATLVEVDWTLSFTTDVDARDQVDYTASGIDLQFRPHDRIRTVRDPSAPKNAPPLLLHVDRDQARLAAAYAAGWRVSDQPPTHSDWRPFRSEKQLRLAGKWETLTRGSVSMSASELNAPRLDVTYLRRQNGALISGPDLPQMKLWMIATIRLPVGVPLYDLVRAQYQVLAPLVTVPVRVAAM